MSNYSTSWQRMAMNTPQETGVSVNDVAGLTDGSALTGQASSWNSFQGMFGDNGWVSPALQGVGVLANSWLGFQQMGMAQDQLNLQKEAWNMQKDEWMYQKDRRTAEEAAYAEVKLNQKKGAL